MIADRRAVAVGRGHQRGAGAEAAGALRVVVGIGVVQAEPAAHHQFVAQLIGETNPRFKALLAQRERRASLPVHAGERQSALEIGQVVVLRRQIRRNRARCLQRGHVGGNVLGDRAGHVRVERTVQAVPLLVHRRVEIPAQAQIKGQAPADLPIVLDVGRIVILLPPREQRVAGRSAHDAQQERRITIAAGGFAHVVDPLRPVRVAS